MSTDSDQASKAETKAAEKPARAPAVFAGLQQVMNEISKSGISKIRENKKQGFKFRGIDDAMDGFAGPLARASLILSPRHKLAKTWEIETNSGGRMPVAMFETTLTFVSTKDASEYTVGPFYGEASDVLDKACTKAQSVALRVALFQAFCVPMGPELDPEHDSADDAGESDLHRGKVDSGSEKRSPKHAPLEDGKPPHAGLSDAQVTILEAKMGISKVGFEELVGEFGQINPTNYRSATKYLEGKA